MAKISVCLTHYNRPEKLAATLDSIVRQTFEPYEVLVWDDCSPKDPTDIVNAYKGRFRRLIYHRNVQNLNMPANLNAVISNASGEYIANLHDADTFDPRLLEKWHAALEQFPTAGLVFCGLDSTNGNPRYGSIEIHDVAPLTPGRDFFKQWFVGRPSSIIWGTVMARRSLYDRLLPFDPIYKNWADVDMWMRMCAFSDIAYIPEPLIRLDNTETKLRRFTWYKNLITHEMILENIKKIYAKHPNELKANMQRQIGCLRKRYVRHMLAGFLHLDFDRVSKGIRLAPRIYSHKVSNRGFLTSNLCF